MKLCRKLTTNNSSSHRYITNWMGVTPPQASITPLSITGTINHQDLEKLVKADIKKHMKAWSGYSEITRIGAVRLVTSKELSIEDGHLTRTMKLRRPFIMKDFADDAAQLLAML